jgi:hypothetical protein
VLKVETISYFRGSGWSPAFPNSDSEQTLVVAFGGAEFADDPEPVQALRRAYPRSHVLACSTAGEIHGTRVHDHSITAAIARFERTTLQSASAPIGPSTSFEAGKQLGEALRGPGLRGVMVLSDGLGVNGSSLARGLNSVLEESVVVTGGLAGDGDRFARTWVMVDDRPVTGHATAVGFYGDDVHIGHGSKGGWDVFGPERRVTRSEGNVLFEVDGKPALALYKEYLGDLASELPASALLFPLAIRHTDAKGKQASLVRTILGVDDQQNSMTFAGDIPQGAFAQLMRANFDRLVQGASDAALMTRRAEANGSAVLSIAISCVGRRLVLRQRTEEETEATLELLPEGTHQVGFYSYGELSPHTNGSCELHNQTMTLTTFAEK